MPRFAVIPGDGVGPEVTREVVRLLEALRAEGAAVAWDEFDLGADRYLETGVALPQETFDRLAGYDAVFVGAFGDPRVPDMAHGREILLGLRFRFDLYVNRRPARLLADGLSPLKGRGRRDLDLVVLRENTEGEYVGAGACLKMGTPEEVAVQTGVTTRRGVERILRYAFECARTRSGRLVMADKHNVLRHTSGLWHRVFLEMAAAYPEVQSRHYFIDSLCHDVVRDPGRFDVIVTGNLFGDILSDLTAALAGGLGLAPSGNMNPETGKGLFEPVHGSAPDLAGRGVANPAAALLSAAMMLEFTGLRDAARRVEAAVEASVREGDTTPDAGGTLSTAEAAAAVLARLAGGGRR